MENASKALIIAGAILISILLISVAIMVISSTQGVQDRMGQTMDSTEISSFNAQFTNYAGTNRSASQVKSLFEKVTASNASNPDQIYMTIGGSIATSTNVAGLNTKKKYKIVIEDKGVGKKDAAATGTADGLYDTITVTEQ